MPLAPHKERDETITSIRKLTKKNGNLWIAPEEMKEEREIKPLLGRFAIYLSPEESEVCEGWTLTYLTKRKRPKEA